MALPGTCWVKGKLVSTLGANFLISGVDLSMLSGLWENEKAMGGEPYVPALMASWAGALFWSLPAPYAP